MFAFVTTSAAVEVNDIPVTLSIGDVFPADDDVVRLYPSFFADEPIALRRTAAPGEKRATKRAARKTQD